jgi:hypothetical protein
MNTAFRVISVFLLGMSSINIAFSQNTTHGYQAGASLSTGGQNTFLGHQAGYLTSDAAANTFVGHQTGFNNRGIYNTFLGGFAGINNTTGQANVMLGVFAGQNNTTGSGNYFLGNNSGNFNTTGGFNVYLGVNSGSGQGVNGDNNVAVGFEPGRQNTGSNNLFLGFRADAVSPNQPLNRASAIGYNARVSRSNAMVLGGVGEDAINVGIGVTNPNYTLTVNGGIGARAINVTTENWADFVFSKDYPLPSLESVEDHIKSKHHLPGIPSETEALNDGIDLGKMNVKLLQKVEELTLYIIEQQKEIKSIKQQMILLKENSSGTASK